MTYVFHAPLFQQVFFFLVAPSNPNPLSIELHAIQEKCKFCFVL